MTNLELKEKVVQLHELRKKIKDPAARGEMARVPYQMVLRVTDICLILLDELIGEELPEVECPVQLDSYGHMSYKYTDGHYRETRELTSKCIESCPECGKTS